MEYTTDQIETQKERSKFTSIHKSLGNGGGESKETGPKRFAPHPILTS